MTTAEKIKKYEDWVFRVSAYSMALSIIGIDKMTVAPPGGAAYRDEREAFLSGELFSIETDPEIIEILGELKDDETIDPATRRAAQLYHRNAMNTVCIPKEEYVAFRRLQNESYDAWLSAKSKDDYSLFAPYLQKVIETQKKMYGYRKSDMDIYDQMLDDFEPGMNREKYDAFFAALKERLVPLIQCVAKATPLNKSCLSQHFAIEKQKQFTKHLLAYLHFDKEWGYQNETEHPFTSWTCENDCRTTTKYVEDNLISVILSTVHEVGHATYEHDVAPEFDGMILSEGISSGMHESQSRLFENYLGRSLPFWQANYPLLQETFSPQLANVGVEEFVAAMNASRPGLVRTEADELTYPMHILIRYELEKALFSGNLSTEGLDRVWDDMYEKYLGVRAEKASESILQDVHWADGSFGYFPTYALGSAFAAQFVAKMKEDIDVDEALRDNRFDLCVAWLKEHVHRHGCMYDADEIMRIATGKPFDVNIYLDYLEEKYTRLYGLKEEK